MTLYVVFLALSLVVLTVIVIIFSLLNDQKKLEERLTSYRSKPKEQTRYQGVSNNQIKDLSQKVLDIQKTIEELRSSLETHIEKIQSLLQEQNVSHPQTLKVTAIEVTDYEDVLKQYLLRNYPQKHSDIMSSVSKLSQNLDEQTALKNHVIEISMIADFNSMSEAKRTEFCQYVNDYLARNSVSIFTPHLGEEYDERSMSLKKQLSPSQKVSKVLYFGVQHHGTVILKADVYVG